MDQCIYTYCLNYSISQNDELHNWDNTNHTKAVRASEEVMKILTICYNFVLIAILWFRSVWTEEERKNTRLAHRQERINTHDTWLEHTLAVRNVRSPGHLAWIAFGQPRYLTQLINCSSGQEVTCGGPSQAKWVHIQEFQKINSRFLFPIHFHFNFSVVLRFCCLSVLLAHSPVFFP